MEDSKRLYVKGSVTEEDLREAFSKHGEIDNIWVARNPPGFAFVTFVEDSAGKDACDALDDKEIAGIRVMVQVARPKEKRERGAMRPGDWACADCNAHNFSRRVECFKCHQPKPAGAGGDFGGRRGGYRGRNDDYDRRDRRRRSRSRSGGRRRFRSRSREGRDYRRRDDRGRDDRRRRDNSRDRRDSPRDKRDVDRNGDGRDRRDSFSASRDKRDSPREKRDSPRERR